MSAREAECAFAGVDERRVAALARRLAACAKEARSLGVEIFGGTGSATIRARVPDAMSGGMIVAEVPGPCVWDGGDGATHIGQDGLMYGEGA
jgi:hypothetical protein